MIATARRDWSARFLDAGWPVPIGLAWAAAAIAAVAVWHATWDDAGITLGYARTLAHTGEIRFGRFGPAVEGFSSPAWLAITAVLAAAWDEPHRLLVAAKLAAAALYAANTLLVRRLLLASGASPPAATVIALAFSLSAGAVVGVTDAMETHLWVLFHLLTALAFARRAGPQGGTGATASVSVSRMWLLACGLSGAVMTRPEGVLTVASAGFAAVLDRHRRTQRDQTRLIQALAVAAAALAALLAWRYLQFSVLVPNSVLAKRWPPYTQPPIAHAALSVRSVLIFALAAFVPAVPIVIAWARRQGRRPAMDLLGQSVRANGFLALSAVSHLGFMLAVGDIWGTPNRTLLPLMPFCWCLLVGAIEPGWPAAWRRDPRLRLAFVLSAALFLLVQAVFLARYAAQTVTIRNTALRLGPACELAVRTGDRWRVATPDVGATVLYWGEDVEIVDLALLNDPAGARDGWVAVQSNLFSGRPVDLIETHGIWTGLSGLDRSTRLRDRYVKVSIESELYFLEKSRLEELLHAPPAGVIVSRPDQLDQARRELVRARIDQGELANVDVPWTWAVELR